MARNKPIVSVRTSGFTEIAANLQRAAREAGDIGASGIRMAAEEVATGVKASRSGKGIPKKDGILAGSVRVRGVNAAAVELVAGGAAAPYALVQHERMDFAHKLGEARYFTRGVERYVASGGMTNALNDMLDEAEAVLAGRA